MKYIITAIAALLALLILAQTVYALTTYMQKGQVSGWSWYSTDPSRVMVNPTTGEIKALWPGSANICGALKSDRTIKHCFTVVVN